MKAALSIQFIFIATANAFIPSSFELSRVRDGCGKSRCMVTGMATSTSASSEVDINNQIANLKRVLLREYTSFFDPMVCAGASKQNSTFFCESVGRVSARIVAIEQ